MINAGLRRALSSRPHDILNPYQKGDSYDGNTERWAKQLAGAAASMSVEQVADKLKSRMWLNIAARARHSTFSRTIPDAHRTLVAADLKSREKAAVDRAATIIVSLELRTFTDQLMAMFLADDERSESADRALVNLRDPAIVDPLLERVEKDPGLIVRCSGLFRFPLVGKSRPCRSAEAARLADPEIRYHAADALQGCRDPELVPRAGAAGRRKGGALPVPRRPVGHESDPESFQIIRKDLLPLLHDEDEGVRFHALKCFGKHKDLAAGPVILELLRSGQAKQHEVALPQAMAALCGEACNKDMHHYWWHAAEPGDTTAIEKAIKSFEAWLVDQPDGAASEAMDDAMREKVARRSCGRRSRRDGLEQVDRRADWTVGCCQVKDHHSRAVPNQS